MPPVTLLALVKHGLFRLGARDGAHAQAVATLERAILRGPRPRAGSKGLQEALATFRREQSALHRLDARAELAATDLDAASALIDRLAAALAPLEGLDGLTRFGDIVARHRDALAKLGTDDNGNVPVFAGEEGNALARVLEDLALRPSADDLTITPADYTELFSTVISDRKERPVVPGARVRIFGALEARLQSVDRIVLGGLVEGTWPPEARTDAWLSRPMRRELKLNLPELRIGLSAHDFTQALGASEVVLSRAAKVAGAPTVSSRFVQRLAAVAGDQQWSTAVARGERYVALARALDQPVRVQRIPQPAPTPPQDARPTYLSVTDVEDLLRDPYTIYAKRILRLAPLDAVDTPPGARDRGNVIHGAIGEFTGTFAAGLPDDPLREMIAIGSRHFAPLAGHPEAQAFWWPRFMRIARWFVDWEAERRASIAATQAEVRGRIEIPLGGRSLTLAARADRIDRLADGGYAILDYKTGQAPTEKQVRTGLSPQLTLEAAILRQGGFADIPAGSSVSEISYVLLKGAEPAGKLIAITFKEGIPDSHADLALARLGEVARRFEDPSQGYRSLMRPMWMGRRYGDFDHLARVKEWSLTGGATDEEEAEGGEA